MTVGAGRKRRRWLRWLFWLPFWFVFITTGQVLVLRWMDPPGSAFMSARRIDAWVAGESKFELRYEWRDWEQIAPSLPISLIAAEDQKFREHHGFDIDAIEQALQRNANGGRVRGASTISQQVAKNLFLWSGRSYLRKALEAWYTLLIETLWPKRRILEVYANIAEFGDGVYGAEAAAQAFFNRPAARLSAEQSARLAAVLPNPKVYNAKSPGPYVQRRARWVQRQVRQLGGPESLRDL